MSDNLKKEFSTLQSDREPIAIIGIGCRFPGGSNNPTAFWDLLVNGKDAIIDVPKERWDIGRFYDPNQDKPGKMYVRSGGFLQERIDQFDALFFGISPREAACLDPQQRVLLEVAWEALEDAGLVPSQLAGSDTGVYIGGFMLDHMANQMSHFNRNQINIHSAVSFTMTMLSNRLSYVFDFRGPSITMDTACSSSLVTLHEACQALWQGECLLALAGGVNIMHRPETPIAMCKGQMLAPDGHSKSFDERADGYGRGEGAGIVVLKPLSAALQDGDDIYALVRGTGVNQDGRTSGITVPNPESQEALVRQVCDQANVSPQQVRYVEAHGTGTAVGDPLECKALGTVLGQDRSPDNACLVGSVKANIGHLEAAAGVASVIKMAMCLKYKQIPPVANLENPNPNIPFETLGLRLPRKLEPMPDGDGPTYVGINSFGYGGTNAHAILEEAPVIELPFVEDTPSTPYLLPLSARSKEALSGQAQSYLTFIEQAKAPALRDICYSASRHREHHNHRLALIADSQTGMIEKLQSFVKLGAESNLIMGQVIPGQAAKPVFVFTGMGPQWWAMGHELLQHEPVFRQKAEECDAVFQRVAGWSILAEMKADENHSKINQTQIAQPANFVLQAALAALWHSWGIEPAAIVGHSVGEVTAAYVAGVLDLEEAISVSYHRSRIQKKVAGQGKMLAVKMTEEEVLAILSGHEDQVSIAAINSPASLTLSGDAKRLEEIAAQLEAKGLFNSFLRVELAYHSPIMESLKDELLQSLSALRPKSPAIPLYSSVTGQIVNEASYDTEYWYQNIRQPVRFAKAIENLNKDGHKLFLEVGSHPVLFTDIKQCMLQNKVRGGSVLTSLRRKQPEIATLLEAFGSFYTLGYPIDWKIFYAKGGHYVKLPTYPWQRETHWNETEEALFDRLGEPNDHPLLGHRLTAPNPCWESTLNQNYLPYLNDHRIQETVVLPGAVYVEMGLAIHQAFYENKPCTLEKLTFHKTLLIHPSDEPILRLNYDDARREYTVHSRSQDDNNWTLHATGTLSMVPLSDVALINLKEICERCQNGVMDAKTFMAQLPRGLQYGPYFQGIQQIWLGSDEVLAHIEGYEGLATEHESYRIHPTLLDISFQSLIALLDDDDPNVYVPVSILKLKFRASPKRQFWSYGCLTNRSAGFIDADIILCDNDGNVLVEINGLRCQPLTAAKVEELEYLKPWFYKVLWEQTQPVDMAKIEKPGSWLLFMDQGGIGEKLTEQLLAHDVRTVIQVRPGSQFQQPDENHFLIRQDSKPDMERLMETVEVGNCQSVVYLWGLDVVTSDDDPTGLAESVACLHFIQALLQVDKSHPPRFFLVTRGAQPVLDSDRFVLAQAPIVGIGRVAATEEPSYRCTLVDIDPDDGVDSIPLLARELLANSPEQELALRGNERYVYRLVRESVETLALEANQQIPLSVSTEHPFELEIGTPGILDELRFRETQRREPGPREVEIKIHASAINTQDVLTVNKRLPNKVLENSFYGDSLGMEAAGHIVRVGEAVKNYQVGDAIVALLRGSFRTYVTLPIDALFAVPKWAHISHYESVGLLWAFVTAYYGLHHVARLQPGEKVLIHAATEGIDLAALQVAQWIGADVFATVDSQAKRDYLSSLGIKHLMDSHSLDFVDQIKALTNGKGVDVILNSLTGEFALKNFSILAPYGRYIEIGQQSPGEKAMPSLDSNFTFAVINIERMMGERPELFRQILNEVWERFQARDFTPLPIKNFPAVQIVEAFRSMAQSTALGKSVISMQDQSPVSILPRVEAQKLFKPEATYLITGGFGGLGLELAKWMVAEGVRHLVLMGRRGAATPEAQQAVQELEQAGTQVRAVAVDVTQEEQITQLLANIADSMPPLRGIIHTAAVLDDGVLINLDKTRFATVMAPKALGAWYLHQHTLNIPLDFFVLFSSVSSLIGNWGQANYVAANTFLDILAHYRRARGLPAISINWGAVETGLAVRNEEIKQHFERLGIQYLSSVDTMAALGHMMRWNPIQIGVFNVDWNNMSGSNNPRFSHLIQKSEEGDGRIAAIIALRHELLTLEPEDGQERIASLLTKMVANQLRLAIDKVDRYQELSLMGMESLTAAELQTEIYKTFGIQFSMLELMTGNSIAKLTEQLMLKIADSATETAHN